MKIVGVQLLHAFKARHPPTRSWIEAWVAETKNSTWSTPKDIKDRFRNASLVRKYVIFNVKGNDYRMVTLVAYQIGIVFVKWIGTHDDYMKINWESESHEGNSR